ncbi:hypothetical protein MNV49_006330 [Pseudohyphozyma bogoriensis]|nr:hypothetical protein MNV49_006330 [Pseudohyphozyma bogoriensis]
MTFSPASTFLSPALSTDEFASPSPGETSSFGGEPEFRSEDGLTPDSEGEGSPSALSAVLGSGDWAASSPEIGSGYGGEKEGEFGSLDGEFGSASRGSGSVSRGSADASLAEAYEGYEEEPTPTRREFDITTPRIAESALPLPSPPPMVPTPSPPPPPPPPQPARTSVLDRGRPKTPDPFSGSSHFASRSTHAVRPSYSSQRSSSSIHSVGERDAGFQPSHRPTPSSTSILDRPRPKTPDLYSSYSAPFSSSHGHSHSLSNSLNVSPAVSRSHTPIRSDTPTSSDHAHGLRASTSSAASGGINAPTAIPPPRTTSILDRPRPKTPEFGNSWPSQNVSPAQEPAVVVKASRIPISIPPTSGVGAGSARRSSEGSLLNKSSPVRPRFASLGGDAPSLSLEFDFGDFGLDKTGSGPLFDVENMFTKGRKESLDMTRVEEEKEEEEPEPSRPVEEPEEEDGGKTPLVRSDGIFEFGGPRPGEEGKERDEPFKKRRRSLASLLSLGGKDKGEKEREKEREKELDKGPTSVALTRAKDSMDSLAPSTMSSKGPSIASVSPSVSSDGFRSEKSEGSVSGSMDRERDVRDDFGAPAYPFPSAALSSQPQLQPQTSPSTNRTRPPLLTTRSSETVNGTYAMDKSLPPTPSRSSPTDSPKGTFAGLGGNAGKISRQLSKLKPASRSTSNLLADSGRSASVSEPSPAPRDQAGVHRERSGSGFQLISATTTKKGLWRGGKDSSTASSTPQSTSTSASNTVGRKFADRFTPKSSTTSTMTNETSDGEGDDSPTPAASGARKGSFGFGGKKSITAALGMSLPAARRSADLLTRSTKEHEKEAPPLPGYVPRRSFDAVMVERRQEAAVPRRPSTDNLLNLASARLTNLTVSTDSTSSHDVALHSASTLESSSTPSPLSADIHSSPEKAVVVSTATRVDSLPQPSAISQPFQDQDTPYSRPTAAPILVRSDSLRSNGNATAQPSAAGTRAAPMMQSSRLPPPPPQTYRKRVKIPDSGIGSDSSMSSAWLDLEDHLGLYGTALAENRPDRGQILSNTLLPFLRREEDSPGPRAGPNLAKRQRQILFRWLATLTHELREMQPTHRGACLEAVAAIAESHFMSTQVLQDDPSDQAQYRSAIVNVLSFAVDKLNDKAVYANTLVFSGRVFALAFFRIEGVALKLLRALPPIKRQFLKRILDEVGVDELKLPTVDLEAYPSHLWSLCLRDLKTYTAVLLPTFPKTQVAEDHFLVQDGDVVVEMSGNWLIRWTASDSDLPFAFYRAYHRQLAAHLVPAEFRDEVATGPVMHPSYVITGPGALFLAASLLEKSDSLVHRNLRSVTSIGPNNANFNTNDSANLNFGQKPKVLELANRRLVSTMLDIVGGPPPAPGEVSDVAADADTRRHTFSKMLQVWIRACVKRTSMWDTRSVFILLDLIEGLIYTLSYPAPSTRGSEEEVIVPRPHESCIEMFDIPFIFSFLRIILSTADNTVTIMRTVAFIYAHFEIFTLRPEDRDALCEHIILDEVLFSRLYLHWNAGVRGYFIRLLVWRLARLGIVAQEQQPNAPRDPRILELFSLLNVRLEAIRKRHDELEPLDDLDDDDVFKPKRSTICSTRGVKEMPFTVDELVGAFSDSDDDEEEEPQELVRTTAVNARKGGVKEVATVARVVSWLKGGLGKGRQNKGSRGAATPEPQIQPFVMETLPPTPVIEDEEPYAGMADTSTDSWTTVTPPPKSPERRTPRPNSSAFFSFEFEGGLTPDAGPPPLPPSSSSASVNSAASGDTAFPLSPNRRNFDGLGAPSPRVSKRFSKRISILPPAALDVLKESGGAVPPIPAQYLVTSPTSYDKKLHPYAVRGLRDYEDALDEWTDWVARLQEEEDDGKKHNKGFMDVYAAFLPLFSGNIELTWLSSSFSLL